MLKNFNGLLVDPSTVVMVLNSRHCDRVYVRYGSQEPREIQVDPQQALALIDHFTGGKTADSNTPAPTPTLNDLFALPVVRDVLQLPDGNFEVQCSTLGELAEEQRRKREMQDCPEMPAPSA